LDQLVEKSVARVADLRGQLRALSPQRTLDRGYAIAQLHDGAVVRDAKDAPAGTPLVVTLARGALATTVDLEQAGQNPGR
jgi:exodeoxyribonuclease VII large subunit